MKSLIFLFIASSLFANESATISEMATFIIDIRNMMLAIIGLVLKAVGWFMLAGMPFMIFSVSLSMFKKEGEQDRSGALHLALVYAKSASMTILGVYVISLLFKFMYVDYIKVAPTFSSAVSKVLGINNG